MSQTAAVDVMQTLRDRTWEKHRLAERNPLQHALATGKLPREQFALLTAQLMIVHRELFAALKRCVGCAAIAAVLRDHQDHEPRCRRDIEHFGLDATRIRPSEPNAKFLREVGEVEAGSAVSLLGTLYVLEGATNGGKFIAKMVRRAYQLEGAVGTESLDPYGDTQPARWDEFKQSMRGVAFDDADIERMVAMACLTFDAVAGIGDDVLGGKA